MRTALVLIDIQNDYFPGGRMELVGSEAAACSAANLLRAFRQAGWPVFHVKHVSVRNGATFFLPDSAGVEIHHTVAPLPGETVVIKNFPNSFRETTLQEQLKSAGIGSVLFCGMMTSMCVDATVRAAFDLGYDCTVAHDACATRDLDFNGVAIPAAQVHGSFLAALGAVYARIRPSEDILAAIAG